MIDLKHARANFIVLCEKFGSDHVAEENAILSIGREFLPPCAIEVLDNKTESVEYYQWLANQTTAAQDEHEQDIAAGHEWDEYGV